MSLHRQGQQGGQREQAAVSSYFDEKIFQRELELIFDKGPKYLGHRQAVPNKGDFYTLPQEHHGRALVHGEHGIELVSNVCCHRQATMLKGRGQLDPHHNGNIVCPIHRWTYDGVGRDGLGSMGALIGAPHFEQTPQLKLKNYGLQEWNGLLFEANGRDVQADLAGMDLRKNLDFSGYVLDHVQMHECDYNWKTFIEIYLEDYHVEPFHPGLGNFVTCHDLKWEFRPEYSIQTVGLSSRLTKAGSAVYEKWHKALLDYQANSHAEQPQYGAIWLTYYPHVMVEWYPHVLTVSTLHPINPQKTMNVVEFFYPEEIAAFEPEFVQAQRAAYMQTCVEDDEIALRMDEGRKALMLRGDDEYGPYQSPMEDGMLHFHRWYRHKMGADFPRIK